MKRAAGVQVRCQEPKLLDKCMPLCGKPEQEVHIRTMTVVFVICLMPTNCGNDLGMRVIIDVPNMQRLLHAVID